MIKYMSLHSEDRGRVGVAIVIAGASYFTLDSTPDGSRFS